MSIGIVQAVGVVGHVVVLLVRALIYCMLIHEQPIPKGVAVRNNVGAKKESHHLIFTESLVSTKAVQPTHVSSNPTIMSCINPMTA